MLNERDRQVLAGIERDLVATSPALARRLRRRPARPTWALLVASAATGVVLAVGLITLGLVADAIVLLALLAGPIAWRLHRRRPRGRARRLLRRRGPDDRGPATSGV